MKNCLIVLYEVRHGVPRRGRVGRGRVGWRSRAANPDGRSRGSSGTRPRERTGSDEGAGAASWRSSNRTAVGRGSAAGQRSAGGGGRSRKQGGRGWWRREGDPGDVEFTWNQKQRVRISKQNRVQPTGERFSGLLQSSS